MAYNLPLRTFSPNTYLNVSRLRYENILILEAADNHYGVEFALLSLTQWARVQPLVGLIFCS